MEKVTFFDLDGSCTDEGLKEVAKLQNLERLSLDATKVTDEGLKEVAKLGFLKWLYLPSQITDAGLKEVAKLRYLTGLGLSGTKITDAGLKEVAKLQKLQRQPQLEGRCGARRYLDLSYTRITGAGVAKLKKALSPYCRIIR